MWHAYLFEIMTGRIGARIEFENATWSMSLNETETFKIECLKSSLPKAERRWYTPWMSGILLMYKDVVVCGGPILAFPQESRKKIHIECRGIRRILGERMIVPEMSDWRELGKQEIQYTGMSLGTIAKRVVEVAQTKPGGRLPITYPVTDEFSTGGLSGSGLPACTIEDGSSGPNPCYWDAQVQGNGRGRSYVVNGSQITYTDSNANHQRTYKSFNVATLSGDAVLTKLSEASRGPDIMFKPRLLDESRVTFDMWTGTEKDPRIYQRFPLLWDTTEGLNTSVTDFSLTQTAAYQASRVFATGAGQDEAKLMSVATNDQRRREGFPFLEKVVTSETEFQTTLDNIAYSQLYANEDQLQEITMTVRADGAIPMGHFWPGDMVQLLVSGMINVPDGLHKARLLNMSGTHSSNIRLSMQLEA